MLRSGAGFVLDFTWKSLQFCPKIPAAKSSLILSLAFLSSSLLAGGILRAWLFVWVCCFGYVLVRRTPRGFLGWGVFGFLFASRSLPLGKGRACLPPLLWFGLPGPRRHEPGPASMHLCLSSSLLSLPGSAFSFSFALSLSLFSLSLPFSLSLSLSLSLFCMRESEHGWVTSGKMHWDGD